MNKQQDKKPQQLQFDFEQLCPITIKQRRELQEYQAKMFEFQSKIKNLWMNVMAEWESNLTGSKTGSKTVGN